MARHMLSWRDDHLPSGMLDRIISAVRGGGPRASALDCLRIPALPEDDREAETIVQERVSDLLDGHDEEASARALETLSSYEHRVEATALAMLRCTGMDAAVAILVAHALSRSNSDGWDNVRLGEFTLTAGPARHMRALVSIEQLGNVLVHAPFAPDVHWAEDAVVIGRPFPHAMCLAMTGRALKDVVDHPILTPLGLTIMSADMGSGGRVTTIKTDLKPHWMGMRDLTMENTRPDRQALAAERVPPRRTKATPAF